MKCLPLLFPFLAACASPLPQAGIYSGDGACTLFPFMGIPAGNEIQTLTNLGGDLIWICSKNGAWLIGQNGRVLKSLSFERSCARAVPVDSNSDGLADFFADRGRGWSDVAVLNLDGSTRWVFDGGGLGSPNDLCCVDFDGNGEVEFFVGLNGEGGLVELSQSGGIIQRTPATNAFSVQALDLNGDGDLELHYKSAGHTCALSSNSYYAPDCLVEERNGWLQFHYSDGKTEELLLEIPGHSPNSVWRLRDGSTAAVRTIKATAHLSAFMMWDPTGNPVYTHVFPVSTLGLAAFIDGEDQERLLLGAGSRLLEVTRKGG